MRWRLFHKPVTDSTNHDARAGKPGDVFTADFQTAGRGRLDHVWVSEPAANLMLSAVLDVADLSPEHVATLPLAVGLAVLRAVRTFVPDACTCALKWPNDIWVDGRKIAGVLCERQGDVVIAGLGVNVRQRNFAPDIASRPTSLAYHCRKVPEVGAVREAVLDALSAVYVRWRTKGFAALYPEIVAHDVLLGRFLGVLQTDADRMPLKGLCGGIQEDGALLVGDTRVYAGEAHILLS